MGLKNAEFDRLATINSPGSWILLRMKICGRKSSQGKFWPLHFVGHFWEWVNFFMDSCARHIGNKFLKNWILVFWLFSKRPIYLESFKILKKEKILPKVQPMLPVGQLDNFHKTYLFGHFGKSGGKKFSKQSNYVG